MGDGSDEGGKPNGGSPEDGERRLGRKKKLYGGVLVRI